jgi:hypothetical protein
LQSSSFLLSWDRARLRWCKAVNDSPTSNSTSAGISIMVLPRGTK